MATRVVPLLMMMRRDLPRWLFVSYGGGHVKALLPVALRVRELGLASPIYLALTTAAPDVRRTGIPTLGFRDLLEPGDQRSREHGMRLAAELKVHATEYEESVAYLGLSYRDLEDSLGPQGATAEYARYGRQAFLPVPTLRRALDLYKPSLVVATNSPRAEQAAIHAANQHGTPAVCLVDLLGVWEQALLTQPTYADALCVLNASVQRRLIEAGRKESQVRVTGNPAFDTINNVEMRDLGRRYRAQAGWGALHVCLYASSPEPEQIPGVAGVGDPALPRRIESALVAAALKNPHMALWIRRHPSEVPIDSERYSHFRIRVSTTDMPLHACIHASDEVIVTTSTVGIEASLAGKSVVQVRGSILDHLAPYLEMGIARKETKCESLLTYYCHQFGEEISAPAVTTWPNSDDATGQVVQVLQEVWGNSHDR
ncbi:hypothetical protein WKW79_27615 [Variovorax robiniae]|uniref:Capsule polysaccharide biosynthesis protein n=1 Tax=Variovorax robiniae TaxID=1836199 RepID=A0ABU8XFQ1_9BURK